MATGNVQIVENVANKPAKLSHKKWKALQKKLKRKEQRQAEARKREEEKDPSPLPSAKELWEEEQRAAQEEVESQRRHALWLAREERAAAEFQRKKEQEEAEEQRRLEEEKQIKLEWEEREKREKQEQEEREEKKKKQEELLKEATASSKKKGSSESSWHNPLAPAHYSTDDDPANTCPFYGKVAACRFGDRCSRGHPVPMSSTTILIPNMYYHFELEQGLVEEYDIDVGLEYSSHELYDHFRAFYEDVVPELRAVGRLRQVKVCCNYEPHLRGNLYVQYNTDEEAQRAFVKFNARWYAGRQLSCQFVNIPRWKNAICGLYDKKKCPKGKNCNFLHCFRNPRNEFWEANFDKFPEDRRHRSRSPSKRRSRSPSRKRIRSKRSRSPTRRSRSPSLRSRSPARRYSSSRRSRSPHKRDNRQSRSPSRNRKSPSQSQMSQYSRYSRARHSRSPKLKRQRSQSPSRRRSRSCGRERSKSPTNGSRNTSHSSSKIRRKAKSRAKSRSVSPSQKKKCSEEYISNSRSKSRSMSPASITSQKSVNGKSVSKWDIEKQKDSSVSVAVGNTDLTLASDTNNDNGCVALGSKIHETIKRPKSKEKCSPHEGDLKVDSNSSGNEDCDIKGKNKKHKKHKKKHKKHKKHKHKSIAEDLAENEDQDLL